MDKYNDYEKSFVDSFDALQADVHANNKEKGFYDKPHDDCRTLLLMHSELSEAVEALREGNPLSKKIPPFSQLQEELADVIIRIMDFSAKQNLNLADAVIHKIHYNKGRPHMHGGKKF